MYLSRWTKRKLIYYVLMMFFRDVQRCSWKKYSPCTMILTYKSDKIDLRWTLTLVLRGAFKLLLATLAVARCNGVNFYLFIVVVYCLSCRVVLWAYAWSARNKAGRVVNPCRINLMAGNKEDLRHMITHIVSACHAERPLGTSNRCLALRFTSHITLLHFFSLCVAVTFTGLYSSGDLVLRPLSNYTLWACKGSCKCAKGLRYTTQR